MKTNPNSFNPIFDKHSHILILGTMPSVKSREVGFYYSHPHNRFWKVLAECFGESIPQSIEDKTQLILANKIALWDVLASCEIKGSDDSSIRKPIYNGIAEFISEKPIEKILCNGTKAYKLCISLDFSLPVLHMPSTSPANASWSLERLTETWKSELV
ncbi:MAG: DNA-deoxyinosine glycosylase [Oscillospiraceae bacterium]|nr:DNA-deoxyinosine glycosylase [Oscillospiraceae bacterium]